MNLGDMSGDLSVRFTLIIHVHLDQDKAEDLVFAEASISMQAAQAKQAMCCSSTFRDLIPIPDGLNQIFIYQGFGGCE